MFDDDHYYLGAVIAEKLRSDGFEVILITPAERVSAWTVNTLEQHSIQRRMLEIGIELLVNRNVVEFDRERVTLACAYTGAQSSIEAATVVTVTSRIPNEELALSLLDRHDLLRAAGVLSVSSIGDCYAPGTIAAAVYSGHRYARRDWPITLSLTSHFLREADLTAGLIKQNCRLHNGKWNHLKIDKTRIYFPR